MPNILFEITLILILIFLNGYFSLAEIALLSVKRNRLKYLSRQGNIKAQKALFLTKRMPEMLSVVQIGITIVGIFAGAFGGATIGKYIGSALESIPVLSQYGSSIGVILAVLAITYLSLVVGELVPKQIALSNPEKFALSVAIPITVMMKITIPAVKSLSIATMAILRLIRIKPAPSDQVVTQEEIRLLISDGVENGVFKRSEQRMVESIFHLGNRPIRDFMTPRKEITWIDLNDPLTTLQEKIIGSDHSVFPVCDGNINNYIGAIETKDVLAHLFKNRSGDINIKDIIQPVMCIDKSIPSLVAIERLKRSSISIVLITEKKSKNIIGIISFHDILEAIAGEFESAQ